MVMTDTDSFRTDVRAWLAENCPPEKRGQMAEDDHCFGGRNWVFKNEAQRLWLERMAARGWPSSMRSGCSIRARFTENRLSCPGCSAARSSAVRC